MCLPRTGTYISHNHAIPKGGHLYRRPPFSIAARISGLFRPPTVNTSSKNTVSRIEKDPLGKRHLCLTEWEQLDDLKQRCETLEPPLYQNFKKSDYDLIDGIGKILLLAIRMEEVSPDDL